MTRRVSCLCVTERRPAFMPWLLWNFDRQTHPERELVVVDSSQEPLSCKRGDVRVIAAPPGTNVPAKRNIALDAAEGDIIAWFDDDDWQHPERLARLVLALDGPHDYAGTSRSWFLDAYSRRCQEYFGYRALIFNTAGYKRELARAVRFDERVRKASDTVWLRDIGARQPRLALRDEQLGLWLCHDENISNARSRRRFPSPLAELQARLGSQAWGDTDAQLDELLTRLPPARDYRTNLGASEEAHDEPRGRPARRLLERARALSRRAPSADAEPPPVLEPSAPPSAYWTSAEDASMQASDEAADAFGLPDVSFALLIQPEDLPQLELVSAHLLRQCKYPFVERLFSAWSPTEGSLRHAARGGDNWLSPPDPTERDELLAAYCPSYTGDARRLLSARAEAELWALHGASSDHVVLCHAGVFLHASGGSWVREGMQRLCADPTLCLLTTQPGPPAGPVGPRTRPNPTDRGAHWDRRARVWRGRQGRAHHGLLDRRRLLGALPMRETPAASLAEWIGGAFEASGGGCASLATRGGWAVQAVGGRLPGVAWLPSLVALVERGVFPRAQLGKLELVLELGATAQGWEDLALLPARDARPQASPRPRAA